MEKTNALLCVITVLQIMGWIMGNPRKLSPWVVGILWVAILAGIDLALCFWFGWGL